MTKFNGSNKTKSSFEAFFNRTKWMYQAYDTNVLDPQTNKVEQIEPKVSKKFNLSERHLFGLVDQDGKPVEPMPIYHEPFPLSMTNDEYYTALPFFKKQIEDLKKVLDKAKTIQCSQTNRWINDVTIYRAYEPPQELYTQYLSSIVTDFVENGINAEDEIGKRFRSYNITHFEDFVNNFLSFCELKYERKPILYSTWYMSGQNSMYSSGLRVKISDLEYGKDQPIYDQLINTPEFEYYKKACMSVGLAFDFNDPSVLVPDFGSPMLEPYLSESTDIFVFYRSTTFNDYNLLYNILINLYNLYVNKQQFVIKFSDFCGKLKWDFNKLHLAPINPVLNDLSIYLKLKSIEDPSLSTRQLATLKKNSEFFQKRFDKQTAIGYINDIYLDLYYSKPFSFKDLYNKVLLREQKKQEQVGTNIFGGSGDNISSY
jgi:hypothetical protein